MRHLSVFLLLVLLISPLFGQTPSQERIRSTLTCDLSVTLESITQLCTGATACLHIEGGTPPYAIVLNNANEPESSAGLDLCFYNLPPGSYLVRVTDTEGCSAELTIDIPFIDYFIQSTVRDVSCYGGSDGAIDLDILIDLAPLYFRWEGPAGFTADTEDIENLIAGVYQVFITTVDEVCVGIGSWEVQQPDQNGFERTVAVTPAGCNADTGGSICFRIEGNHPPFVTTLGATPNDAGIVGPEGCFEQLPAGTYVLTTTDAAGCTESEVFVVPDGSGLEAEFGFTSPPCSDQVDGCLRVQGGTPPYRVWVWTWDGPVTNVPPVVINADGYPVVDGAIPVDYIDFSADPTTTDFYERCAENIPPGFYLILVMDTNNCYVLLPVHIPPSLGLQLETNVIPVSCDGGDDGAIKLRISGGEPPYYIELSNGDAYVIDGHEIAFENLPAGEYTIFVSDSQQCSASVTVTIEGGNTIQSNLDFDPFGSYACVAPSGGSAPYAIRWYDLEENIVIGNGVCVDDLPEGAYLVWIRDQHGCITEDIFFIDEAPCTGGEAVVEPSVIHSGEATTFTLTGHHGAGIQWQFKTDITDWLNIPGATEAVYHTPPLHSGSDKLILVRARVSCADGEVLYSSVAELKLLADYQLVEMPAAIEDYGLFDPGFRQAALAALTKGQDQPHWKWLEIYPTVSRGTVFVQAIQPLPAGALLSVLNSTGQQLQQQLLDHTESGETIHLDLGAYAPGIYFIRVRFPDGSNFVERVVLQKA